MRCELCHDEVLVVLTSVPSVCSQSEVFPVVGGVIFGLFPCGKGGKICQVALLSSIIVEFFFCPIPPRVLMDFVVLPPGHGSSVTYF